MQASGIIDTLLQVFEKEQTRRKGDHKFAVSKTVSTFAVLYEKARNAVEFRAEHLVRRAAIERILKRKFALENNPDSMAENLVLELLWAKYFDSSLIDTDVIRNVSHIIKKYLHLRHAGFSGGAPKYQGMTWDLVVGIASVEIDEEIVPSAKRTAMVNFVYQSVRPKIILPHIPSQALNMLTYIAVERTYAQSDNALILFHLLTMMDPEWTKTEPHDVGGKTAVFISTIQSVQNYLNSPVVSAIGRYLRKKLPPFFLFRDFLFEKGKDARGIIEDQTKFEEALTSLANNRYKETGQKIQRAVIRSIIYIFLTKMVFALLLEVPFDLFISKKLEWLPLTINAVFPPILLFLIASFISVPGADNTKHMIEKIKLFTYHFDDYQKAKDSYSPHTTRVRPLLTGIFTVFYTIGFVLSFGLIVYILTKLHFNVASQIIFVFFVALVSLFAYRIRQSAKEYEMVEKGGILEPLIDFFFLPILYAGDLLSREIAKINIFIFIFDFILEAPLKVIFEVAEEWISFIRNKKEELI